MSDLSEYHSINLVSALRDLTHSPRMLLCLIAELPEDSAFKSELRGEPRGWRIDNQQLAAVLDAIQDNSWVTARVAGNRKAPRPKRSWRPKLKQKPTVVTVAELIRRG